MATANLRYRKNGGAVQSTSAEVASGDVISLLATSYAGWATPAARWEIVAYPPGWSVPSGWSTDASTGRYYYLANSGGSGVVPPDITIPDPATTWGKWTFRLTVNGSVVSSDISVETVSPNLGLHDLAFGEGSQFGGTRSYVGPHQENLRTVDAAALVGGGYVASIAATTPLHVSGSTGAVTATWQPTANVAMSTYRITGLGDPSSAQDAATKAYVDSVAAGLDPKASVFVATTASITLSGAQTVDGVSVTAGKRVLVKDQGSSATGIYVSAAGSWTRATDLAAGASAAGAYCFVEQGTTNGDKGFVCTNNVGSDVVGTDTLTFTQFTGGSSGLDAATAVLEDTTTALNANGIPIRATTSTVEFASTSVAPLASSRGASQATTSVQTGYDKRTVTDASGHGATNTAAYRSFYLPDGAGTNTEAARMTWYWTNIVGPYAAFGLDVATNPGGGGLIRAVTFSGGGAIRLHGAVFAHDGYRLIVDASGNLSASAITFDEVNAALAGANASVTLNGQQLTTGDLVVSGDLTVSGTTTTVNSTAVSLADRLVVFNSSTGVVSVPVNIAGFVIDRGSADGSTKRDMPGLFWDETNTRFDLAYNTAGDQSTIGSFVGLKLSALTVSSLGSGIAHMSASGVMSSSAIVNADVDAAAAIAGTKISPDFGAQNITTTGSSTAGSSGFVGPQIDRATLGTFAFGSNINAVTFTAALSGITTLAASDTATITKTALGTTSAAGVHLVNTTSGAGNQYTPGLRMSSFSGATQKQAAIEHRALGTSRSQIIALYGSGSTYPTSTLALFDESDSTFFDVRTRSNGFVSSQGTAGYLFTSGTGLYSSGSNDLECRSTATSAPLLLKGNKSTGGTGAAVTSRAYSGTQTAGYLHNFESGSTQMAGVAYDGTWEGPVLRNTSTKSSNYSAALYDLVEYSVGGGTFTVTLPNPAAGTQGRFIVTKNIGSSGTPLSVATGTGNIDNAATIQVAGGYASDTFVADNANGYLRIAAIRPWNITATKTADYTTAIGEVVKCDPSGAGFNVELPAIPSTATLRDVDVIVKNITSSTNTITIRPQAGQTIDGAANVTITTARGVVRLLAIPGGTDWMII